MGSNSSRLIVVDALRGFAIVCIMLFHNMEHFDLYYFPAGLPAWMLVVDKIVWKVCYFLFANKAYGIFAFLFGLTFYIQFTNQQKIGKDFRARFAWRMLLLLIFGLFNSAFFEGDILSMYAVLGLCLIPVAKLNNKAVLCIAIILLLQPCEMARFITGLRHPQMVLAELPSNVYYARIADYIPKRSLLNTIAGNVTNGRMGNILWQWETGRVVQTVALFMLGMLAGRKKLFDDTEENKRFWLKVFIAGILLFALFHTVGKIPAHLTHSYAILNPLYVMLDSWTNFSFMLVLTSCFILLFKTKYFNKKLSWLSCMGRMSLSNYIMQSVMGSFVYYGFGLGLYKYTGATYCLLIGITLAALQFLFSYLWMKTHKQGPLETIWHKATWAFYK